MNTNKSETKMPETTALKTGQTWRNDLDADLRIVGNAVHYHRTIASDIWVAEKKDPLFGTMRYLVTAAGLAEAGYKEVMA